MTDNGPLDYKTGIFTSPTSTINKVVTGLGFKPRYIEFQLLYSDNQTSIVDGKGATDGSGHHSYAGTVADTPAAAMDVSIVSCLAATTSAGALFQEAVFVSFDKDGFTINFTTVHASGWTWAFKAFR